MSGVRTPQHLVEERNQAYGPQRYRRWPAA